MYYGELVLRSHFVAALLIRLVRGLLNTVWDPRRDGFHGVDGIRTRLHHIYAWKRIFGTFVLQLTGRARGLYTETFRLKPGSRHVSPVVITDM